MNGENPPNDDWPVEALEQFVKCDGIQQLVLSSSRGASLARHALSLRDQLADRDKEWFQIIESFADFHPISMADALDEGIKRAKAADKKLAQAEAREARLREALEKAEWDPGDQCVVCFGVKQGTPLAEKVSDAGHQKTCAVGNALSTPAPGTEEKSAKA